MLKYPLFHFILKALMWLPLALTIWINCHTILAQALQSALNPLLKISFNQIQAEMKQYIDETWIISTRILMKEQPEDISKRRFLNLKINNPVQHTLTLPLLWIILLALSVRGWKTWLLSHVILAGITIVTSFCSLFLLIANVLAESSELKIELFNGFFQTIQTYPAWFVSFISIISITSQIVMIFSPLFIAYWLQKTQCQALLLTNTLVIENIKK